ncbi:MAG: hypothetical protein C0501_30275, partial [Isosphaera sp.]|nr:hypothetical protein [Isosphaera sp.]
MAGLGLGYAAAGFGGLAFPYIEENVTLLWPPTGIAVAVLFRAGLGYWPGVFLGALAVNLTLSSPLAAAG